MLRTTKAFPIPSVRLLRCLCGASGHIGIRSLDVWRRFETGWFRMSSLPHIDRLMGMIVLYGYMGYCTEPYCRGTRLYVHVVLEVAGKWPANDSLGPGERKSVTYVVTVYEYERLARMIYMNE